MALRERTAIPYSELVAAAREPGWRAAARDAYLAKGLPTARDEDWKYSDLSRAHRGSFAPAIERARVSAGELAPFIAEDDGNAVRLVFLDGMFAPELSAVGDLPDGVVVGSLAGEGMRDEALGQVAQVGEDAPIAALNTALFADGAYIRIGAGVALDRPVHVVQLAIARSAPRLSTPRVLVIAEADSALDLIETYGAIGGQASFTSAVSEIVAGEGARLRHVRRVLEGARALHVGIAALRLAAASRYHGFVLSSGGALARSEVRAALTGEGVECRIDGAGLLRERRHADLTTEIDHRAPHCESYQLYKSVVDDAARSVFQGRIRVAPGAQKTNAFQMNRNLLLSDQAQASGKPELRIFADDVKCSHGSTTGALDADALFYLESRGIAPDTARALLIEAFVAEIIEEIPIPMARAQARAMLAAWLGETGAMAEEAA